MQQDMQQGMKSVSVAIVVTTGKLTGAIFKAMVKKIQNKIQNPSGKQSVKKLIRKDQGVSSIEVKNADIQSFSRIAKKYGVDFAIKKDRSGETPQYLVFFKAKDSDALTAAFKEYTNKSIQKAQKPSVLSKLDQFRKLTKNPVLDKSKIISKEMVR